MIWYTKQVHRGIFASSKLWRSRSAPSLIHGPAVQASSFRNFHLRRKVPPELRQALGNEYKRSLKTRDPGQAKALFAEEWARSEAIFTLARAQSNGVDTLGERDMQQLVARWFRSQLQQLEASGDFASRLVAGSTSIVEARDAYRESVALETLRQALDEDPDWDISEKIGESIKKALAAHRIRAPTDARVAARLAAVLAEPGRAPELLDRLL